MDEELSNLNILKIDNIFIHENYNNVLNNDIALIRLQKPVESNNITTIFLAQSDDIKGEVVTAGWFVLTLLNN